MWQLKIARAILKWEIGDGDVLKMVAAAINDNITIALRN